MLHRIIVCCLVVVALAFPARASSLWHPEPGFLPEDARHAVPNNPAPPERTVPEQVLPPLPVQDEGTIPSQSSQLSETHGRHRYRSAQSRKAVQIRQEALYPAVSMHYISTKVVHRIAVRTDCMRLTITKLKTIA